MTREDIAKIFADATDEQIDAVLNINSSDIGKAKGDAKKLKEDLDAAKASIADLEKNKGDIEAFPTSTVTARSSVPAPTPTRSSSQRWSLTVLRTTPATAAMSRAT